MLSGCAAPQSHQRETYVVRPEDTLYSIAWRHDLDFRELAKWNNIGPDFRLSVGQVLVLEPAEQTAGNRTAHSSAVAGGRAVAGSTASRPVRGGPAGPTPAPAPRGTVAGGGGAAAAGGVTGSGGGIEAGGVAGAGGGTVAGSVAGAGGAGGTATGAGGASKWLWPTEHSAPPRAVPGGGILLFGHLGQDVRAAGAGRVVYTGSGIRGYGNLIILKHADNLLSSYAHNREMLVHEGQDVVQGQIIAHMGTAAHQTSALYFEIRLNGKPVDPLKYLPGAK